MHQAQNTAQAQAVDPLVPCVVWTSMPLHHAVAPHSTTRPCWHRPPVHACMHASQQTTVELTSPSLNTPHCNLPKNHKQTLRTKNHRSMGSNQVARQPHTPVSKQLEANAEHYAIWGLVCPYRVPSKGLPKCKAKRRPHSTFAMAGQHTKHDRATVRLPSLYSSMCMCVTDTIYNRVRDRYVRDTETRGLNALLQQAAARPDSPVGHQKPQPATL
jgi:hypothetical protein